jgi:hypothetical protein
VLTERSEQIVGAGKSRCGGNINDTHISCLEHVFDFFKANVNNFVINGSACITTKGDFKNAPGQFGSGNNFIDSSCEMIPSPCQPSGIVVAYSISVTRCQLCLRA